MKTLKNTMTLRRALIIPLSVLMLMLFVACPVNADSDPLTDKKTYYTGEEDYIPGDCILTATRMMIRRAAIMNGASEWEKITNEALRPDATVDGCLLSSFSFKAEGLKYKVGFGEFEGEGDGARIAEFAALLEDHPEGVVVHGDWAAEYGMHGVLVTAVEDGVVYAMDAACNMESQNEGILKWSDTTMLEPSCCTRYWYLKDIEGCVKAEAEEPAAEESAEPAEGETVPEEPAETEPAAVTGLNVFADAEALSEYRMLSAIKSLYDYLKSPHNNCLEWFTAG